MQDTHLLGFCFICIIWPPTPEPQYQLCSGYDVGPPPKKEVSIPGNPVC